MLCFLCVDDVIMLFSEYFKCCNYNIISVDYNPIATGRCYEQGAHNTKLVGMCIAQLVEELVQHHGFNLSLIHTIGFSLGAQIVSYIGTYLKSGQLNRITGILFSKVHRKVKYQVIMEYNIIINIICIRHHIVMIE